MQQTQQDYHPSKNFPLSQDSNPKISYTHKFKRHDNKQLVATTCAIIKYNFAIDQKSASCFASIDQIKILTKY